MAQGKKKILQSKTQGTLKTSTMDLIKLGSQIKEERESKGISLNKMSNDLYGNRYRVNHLSEIEKGNVDLRFSQAAKILNYLKVKSIKLSVVK